MNKQLLFKTLIRLDSHLVGTASKHSVFSSFLLGVNKNKSLIDLAKVLPLLKKILFLIREVYSNRGSALIILDDKVPYDLECQLGCFFQIMKNSWSEGSVSNLSVIKKTCYKFNKLPKNVIRQKSNQSAKFFKKYKTIGFNKRTPRLIISFVPLHNKLFFEEIKLLNIPFISLVGYRFSEPFGNVLDYPILLNNKDYRLNNLLLSLFLQEAKKGKKILLEKFEKRRTLQTARFRNPIELRNSYLLTKNVEH